MSQNALAKADPIGTALAKFDPAELRENKVMRKTAAEAAAKIAERFGQMGKRKLQTN